MKLEKKGYKSKKWFYYYYRDSQTNYTIYHGLFNSNGGFFRIGYCYHNEKKGFWLR